MRAARPHNIVISGPDGSGKTELLRSTLERGQGAHVHEVEPMGGSEVWSRLDTPPMHPGQWDEVWRKIFLIVSLTQVNAHKNRLSPLSNATLSELRQPLHPQIFAHYNFKNFFTIASRISYEPQPLKTFEARRTWEDVELFLTRMPAREKVVATQWIDNFDQYFDNQPQLLMKVQASLAHYLLRHDAATSLIHTGLTIRSVTRDYWLKTTGHDLASSPGYREVRDDKENLKAIFQEELVRDLDNESHVGEFEEKTSIWVPQRDATEDFFEYILRHTFLTRAGVRRMASSLARLRNTYRGPLPDAFVRRSINERAFENAQMEVHQIASDLRALSRSTSNPPSQETTISILKDMIHDLGSELVTRDDLQDRMSNLPDALVPPMLDTLWRHRLLLVAPDDDPSTAYCSASSTDRWDPTATRFRFHPALIELCSIKVTQGANKIEYLH